MVELSIVIVNWNTKKLVLECLTSIITAKPKTKIEIIVVDNGSSDKSVEALKIVKSANKAFKITIIESKKNLGFSKANNLGIKSTQGSDILLLNSDTKIVGNTIDTLYEFAQQNKDAAIVGPKLLNEDGSNQASVYKLPTLLGAINQYWFGLGEAFGMYKPKGKEEALVEGLVMAAMYIKRSTINKVGLLDERYFMYFEDLAYCRKAKLAGLMIYYLPKARVYHLVGASGRSIADDKDQWRRLIPSSKIYHGAALHYIINFVLWTSQKLGIKTTS